MYKLLIVFLTLFLLCNCTKSDSEKVDKDKQNTDITKSIKSKINEKLPASFNYLKTIKVDEYAYVHYNPEFTTIINKDISQYNIKIIQVLKTKINESDSHNYTIDYSQGPSADPGFLFYRNQGDSLKQIGYYKNGLELFIPSNGYVYISGHTDNMYDQRKKYKVHFDDLVEIKQPYYYVGIKSKLEDFLEIYSDLNYKTSIGKLPIGAPVTVLLNIDDDYLIKTSFGLVGWAKIPPTPFKGKIIEEIYFAGD